MIIKEKKLIKQLFIIKEKIKNKLNELEFEVDDLTGYINSNHEKDNSKFLNSLNTKKNEIIIYKGYLERINSLLFNINIFNNKDINMINKVCKDLKIKININKYIKKINKDSVDKNNYISFLKYKKEKYSILMGIFCVITIIGVFQFCFYVVLNNNEEPNIGLIISITIVCITLYPGVLLCNTYGSLYNNIRKELTKYKKF